MPSAHKFITCRLHSNNLISMSQLLKVMQFFTLLSLKPEILESHPLKLKSNKGPEVAIAELKARVNMLL